MKRLFKFFKSVGQEMKLVAWPTMKQTRRDSWVVVSTSILFALYFALCDFVLNKLLTQFIFKQWISGEARLVSSLAFLYNGSS